MRDPAPDRSRSASTPPTSGCPAPGRTWCATSSGWRARLPTQRLHVRGELRRAHGHRGHQADRRDLAARRACRSSAARSSGRARSGSTPKGGRIDQLLRLTEEAITFAVRRRAAGDVRDRGHDARGSRDAAPAVLDGDPRRRARACASPTPSATRRRPARRRSCASSRRSSRSAAAASASTGTATAIATSPSINTLAALDAGATRRARRGDRHRRARRQHADGHAARQPGADGLHRARSLGARRVLPRRSRRRPACRFRRTIRSSAATRSAPRPACTPRR